MRKLVSKATFFVFLATFIGQTVALPLAQAQAAVSKSEAVRESISVLEKDAARLLIFNSVLANRVGDVVEVSPAIAAKYNSMRNAVLGSVPTAVVGGATVALFNQSLDEFESVLKPITAFIKAVGRVIGKVLEKVVNWSVEIGLDKLFESSGKVLEAVWDIIQPIVRLSINKGSAILSATLTGSASLYTSSFLFTHDANEAMTKETVRKLLGEDEALKTKVDAVVSELGYIYLLDASKQAQFKAALLEEITRQAVEKKFDAKATYNVDVLDILTKRNLIAADQAAVARTLKAIYASGTTNTLAQSDAEVLKKNVTAVTALAAILEEMALSGKLSEGDQKEVANLLVKTQRNLKLVQSFFVK